MPRNDNLIPIDDRPAEEARAIRAAGGRAAAKAKARNNKLRERLNYMLEQKTEHTFTTVEQDRATGHSEVVSTNGTYYDWMISQMIRKACNGDMAAINKILDVLGDDGEQQSD